MEEILENLKAHILGAIGPYITALSTTEIPLAALADKNIIVGDCDLDRHQYPVCLFINPDRIELSDLSVCEYESNLSLDFLFVCRKDTKPVLYRKVLRYMAALQKLFVDDLSLGGVAALDLESMDYFDAMEGTPDSKGALLTATVRYV